MFCITCRKCNYLYHRILKLKLLLPDILNLLEAILCIFVINMEFFKFSIIKSTKPPEYIFKIITQQPRRNEKTTAEQTATTPLRHYCEISCRRHCVDGFCAGATAKFAVILLLLLVMNISTLTHLYTQYTHTPHRLAYPCKPIYTQAATERINTI